MLKYRISAAIASVAFAASLGGVALAAEPAASAAAETPATTSQASDAGVAPTIESQTLGMEKLGNARQLGGYVGADGKVVKDGLLLRTAKLADATQADLDKLVSEYNLGYVVDFRTTAERAQAPDPEIDGVENVWCSIIDEDSALGGMASGAASSASDAESSTQADKDASGNQKSAAVVGGSAAAAGSATSDSAQADPQAVLAATVQQLVGYAKTMDLSDMYVDIADSAHSQQGYRQFFDVLLNNKDGKAVLWHCTAGKDRAGLGAVLVLSALGVDRETALEDFDLTNAFNEQSIDAMVQVAQAQGYSDDDIQAVRDLAGVNRAYMEKALDHIDATYGSMHDYLVNQIGLTEDEIAQLQEMYLA